MALLQSGNVSAAYMPEREERGGFNFDNVARNEMMSNNGLAFKAAMKTGTTITGVCFDGGVVLGADTRSTNGETVADKNCEKIHYMAPNIYCCGAGTAADTENVTGMIASELELLRLRTCLVLRQLATNAPVAFFMHMPAFFQRVWTGLVDPHPEIREAACDALCDKPASGGSCGALVDSKPPPLHRSPLEDANRPCPRRAASRARPLGRSPGGGIAVPNPSIPGRVPKDGPICAAVAKPPSAPSSRGAHRCARRPRGGLGGTSSPAARSATSASAAS